MKRAWPHLPLGFVLLVFIVAGMTMTAQAQKIISNPVEHNTFVSAMGEQHPQIRIGALEAFLRSYPNSAVREDALEALMATYESVGNVPQAISTAGRLLQINPSNRAALTLMAQKAQQRSAGEEAPVLGLPALSVPSPRVYVEPSTRLLRDTFEVSAGRALTHNFSLTRGTTLVAQFQVTGGLNQSIDVLLLDVPNYQRYMAGQQFSAFQGTSGAVREIAQYTFQVPQTNVYYLVLDNRRAWLLARRVTLYAHAILPEPTAEHVQQQRALAEGYENLKRLFLFPDFQISLRYCGAENAFSDPNITLCKELVEAMGDQRLEAAMTFVLFHELGHSLLRLWEQPGWDNEDFADEFATALMIMGKQQSGAGPTSSTAPSTKARKPRCA
ncbi:MAG: hypothetical protein L0Z53_08265 [Acidobacteriales bacterium]|nr:hypothetical protein [Terriglobales bacterium]